MCELIMPQAMERHAMAICMIWPKDSAGQKLHTFNFNHIVEGCIPETKDAKQVELAILDIYFTCKA